MTKLTNADTTFGAVSSDLETPGSGRENRLAFSDAECLLDRVFRQTLFSRGFLALCDQGVVSLGNFLTGLSVGRLAGKTELGFYALCWTIVSLTVDLSGAITTTPYTVFSPKMQRSDRRRYVGDMLLLHIVISLAVAGTVLFGSAILFPTRSGDKMLPTLMCMGATLTLLNGREFSRRILFADMEIRLALVLDSIFTLMQLAGLVCLWRCDSLKASTVYSLIGIVAFAQMASWLFLYRAKIEIHREWWTAGFKNWQFSKWVLGSGILFAAASYLYPWLLAAFDGAAATGLWASCAAVVAVGNPVLGGFVNYLGPKLSTLYAHAGVDAMRRYVYFSSAVLAVLLCPFVLTLSIWGGHIVTSLYGPGYSGTSPILLLLALNLLALSFTHPFSRGLFALEAAKADMIVNVAAFAILFTVGVVAVKHYSLIGAAAALLLSTASTAILRVAVFLRVAKRLDTRPAKTWVPLEQELTVSDAG